MECWAGLPADLAHPLEDDRAVAVHALGAALEGSRQNGGEASRLFAGVGYVVSVSQAPKSEAPGAPDRL